ncbi:MAG TPA: maltose alpha-D-glucosyltransferase [Polyangiaceae bacterium]
MSIDTEQSWFKDAVLYEIRLRSFYDADGDGIGDFRGLTEKLDYLVDLGVNTIWLLPFYPSPLKDDGYDIADYTTVHPSLGTLKDFKQFLKAAHQRNLRVVTELVLNHTSDQHPWFQRSRRAPAGSRYRDFYVWTDNPDNYAGARIIFQDFEASNWTWDPIAKAYFWHRFYSNQPDLNFDNPEVQKAMLGVVDFWFELGVDGLRLDAVPYLFEREGTNCENLPETHAFLRRLRKHIDRKFKNRMLLAEANQWPEDAVAYFGNGDECHMCFHFPIMPRLFMALRMEDYYPILDILEQTPGIPEGCQWAVFLRNHDELTLEMVTDEERDYMVDAYAIDRTARINLGIRRRLAPLLENNRRRIELMKGLLFSLPGTPVLYYGDEIGMGDNVYLGDRNGVRTPMQWNGDRNAGFSRSNPQRLVLPPIQDPEYHFSSINVEAQQANESSLLWWTKRIISLRKQFRAFGRGSFEPLGSSNRRVLAFLRRYQDEVVLVVANLSRFAQYVELDLREFTGVRPRELFGSVEFPEIGPRAYLVMCGPHAFYWFSLSGHRESHEPATLDPGVIHVNGSWDEALEGRAGQRLTDALKKYLPTCRWFRGKTRQIRSISVYDAMALDELRQLVFAEVTYTRGDPDLYAVPLAFHQKHPTETALLRVHVRQSQVTGTIAEASQDPAVAQALLKVLVSGRKLRGKELVVTGKAAPELKKLKGQPLPEARSLGLEQTNTSYAFGDQLVAKLMRLVEDGRSTELAVLDHLHKGGSSPIVPSLLGHLELQFKDGSTRTLGLVQNFVPNQGNAWSLTLDAVGRYYDQVLVRPDPAREPRLNRGILELLGTKADDEIAGLIGPYLGLSELLGRRTGELHQLLSAPGDDPEFKPDGFEALAKRAFYQSLRNLASRSFDAVRASMNSVAPPVREVLMLLLKRERDVHSRLNRVRDTKLKGLRIRVHGDFHLGQVLFTGRDFVIIDFEGEPGRSRSHRRALRSPIADVAGMLRSFHYAAHIPLRDEARSHLRDQDIALLNNWADVWQRRVSAAFIDGYLAVVEHTHLLPTGKDELEVLLNAYLIEKALYELLYELNHRPDWVVIPAQGLLDLLDKGV